LNRKGSGDRKSPELLLDVEKNSVYPPEQLLRKMVESQKMYEKTA